MDVNRRDFIKLLPKSLSGLFLFKLNGLSRYFCEPTLSLDLYKSIARAKPVKTSENVPYLEIFKPIKIGEGLVSKKAHFSLNSDYNYNLILIQDNNVPFSLTLEKVFFGDINNNIRFYDYDINDRFEEMLRGSEIIKGDNKKAMKFQREYKNSLLEANVFLNNNLSASSFFDSDKEA